MDATFVQVGKTVDYTPGSAVDAGDVIVQGELVGVANLDIAANALGALAIQGVFDFAKTTGSSTAITAGSKCYWDAAAGVAKTDPEAGANKYIGICVKAAADADDTVRIAMGYGNVTQAATVAAPAALTASALAAKTSDDAPAATASAAPAGGTGATAGAYDSAENRDLMIASQNNLITDVNNIRTKFNLLQDDYDDIRTKYAALLADVTALRTTLANTLSALKTAGLVASA